MRLISTSTLDLLEVWAESAPPYAILSHRWSNGDDEVSLVEYRNPTPGTKRKTGWAKITACARQALRDGIAYLWVDTCCIDQTSSAELSEAINSMYRWYARAAVCYVYLSDVPYEGAFSVVDAHGGGGGGGGVPFEQSQWHTRGWTLQELLAPTEIRFYSKEWRRLDDDDHAKVDIHSHISRATGIGIDVLKGDTPVHSATVAMRMSWASRRQTTRTEDMAYCLLGIFDVNMPMLYGEGPKAFMRLQEEIMKTSRDQTLFVWAHVQDDPIHTGLLAPHPRNFKDSAYFEDKSQLAQFDDSGYRAEREGVTLSVFLNQDGTARKDTEDRERFTMVLKCAEGDMANRFTAIQLVKYGLSQYMRIRQSKLQRSRLVGIQKEVFIRHQEPPQPARQLKREYVRILFETNCPNAYIFAIHSKSRATPPEFRSQRARATTDLNPANDTKLAAKAELASGRRLMHLDEGKIPPLRQLRREKNEVFFPMDHGLGYDVALSDLKWALPLLPNSTIAYLRIVPGVHGRTYRGLVVAVDGNAQLGFSSTRRDQATDRGDSEPISTSSISFLAEYELFLHQKYFDHPTADDEVMEIKLSLRHHEKKHSDDDGGDGSKELQSSSRPWEYNKCGADKCPCS